jgi:hypothetical protein
LVVCELYSMHSLLIVCLGSSWEAESIKLLVLVYQTVFWIKRNSFYFGLRQIVIQRLTFCKIKIQVKTSKYFYFVFWAYEIYFEIFFDLTFYVWLWLIHVWQLKLIC